MNNKTRVTAKGQVTIPKRVRDALGVKSNSQVSIDYAGDGRAVITKARRGQKSRFAKMVGTLKSDMTTDEIMKFLRGDPAEDPGFSE